MERAPHVVVVDHHDSYTSNLVRLVATVSATVPVLDVPLHGVQFHPEWALSEHGTRLLANVDEGASGRTR